MSKGFEWVLLQRRYKNDHDVYEGMLNTISHQRQSKTMMEQIKKMDNRRVGNYLKTWKPSYIVGGNTKSLWKTVWPVP